MRISDGSSDVCSSYLIWVESNSSRSGPPLLRWTSTGTWRFGLMRSTSGCFGLYSAAMAKGTITRSKRRPFSRAAISDLAPNQLSGPEYRVRGADNGLPGITDGQGTYRARYRRTTG